MRAHGKFIKYAKQHGITKTWFADQLGLSQSKFSLFCSGQRALSKKCWLQMIKLTDGHVSLSDLVADALIENCPVEIPESESRFKCIVFLKDV